MQTVRRPTAAVVLVVLALGLAGFAKERAPGQLEPPIASAKTARASVACPHPTRRSAKRIPRGDLPRWRRIIADDFTRDLRDSSWGKYSGQPGGDPGGWWDPSHVVVANGLLNLQTYRDRRFGSRWVSGGVSSSHALKQTYGKYEIRFRRDPGKGVAAILLLFPSGDNWPPEIDFAEDGGMTAAPGEMSATLHYGQASANNQIQRTLRCDFTRWHTLGVEWTPGKLVYTVDGRRWGRVVGPQVPAEPMELDLQAQAGTCGDRWAPCPDSTTPSRVDIHVDWVVAWAYRPRR
jgi:beta-glucanase (GH16 family)